MNKLNTLTIILFGAGAILLYAGIKDVNPKDVITLSLSGKSPAAAASTAAASAPVTSSLTNHPAKPNGTGITNV